MQAMKTVICDEADAIVESSVLLCAGEVLDEELNVSNYPAIKDGARVILQKRPVVVSLQRQSAKFTATMPQVGMYLTHKGIHCSISTGNRCKVFEPMDFFKDRKYTDPVGV